MHETDEGVPVIEKSLLAEVLLWLRLKKAAAPAGVSGLAAISMVTPAAGIPDEIVTFSGKSGPGEGGSTWLLTVVGVVFTWMVASPQPLPELFLQLATPASNTMSRSDRILLITALVIVYVVKYISFWRAGANLFGERKEDASGCKYLYVAGKAFFERNKSFGTFNALYLLQFIV